MSARRFTAAVCLLLWIHEAWAGNPANPILFVTQMPMPEEVDWHTVLLSTASCVSPFGSQLGDTGHAGRGGSLFERFSNGQVSDLLAIADWSAIPGGKPVVGTVAVRNPCVYWDASKAIFSMVIGIPSGPSDTTQFQWQLYEITLPTQAQLNASVKPVLSKLANQPAYNNVSPCYAPGGKIVFGSDRPYNGQAQLTQREEYLGQPTVSGLWSLDPAANSLQLLVHSPSGAFNPTIDSGGRVIFTNWDHLTRDSRAFTDSRAPVTSAPYNENFTQTFNGSVNFSDETAAAAFTPITSLPPNSWDIFPEPMGNDQKALIDIYGGILHGSEINIFLPWMVNPDGTAMEIVNHVGRHEVAGAFSRNFLNDSNLVDLSPTANPGYGGLAAHPFFNNLLTLREDPLNPGVFYGSDAPNVGTHCAGQIVKMNNAGPGQNPDSITVTYVTSGFTGSKPSFIPPVHPSMNLPQSTVFQPLTNAETLYRNPTPLADGNLVGSKIVVKETDYNTGTVAAPASVAGFNYRLTSLKLSGSTYVPDVTLTSGISISVSYYVGSSLVSYSGPAWELDPAEVVTRSMPAAATTPVDPIEAAVFTANGVDLPTFQNYLTTHNEALSVSRNVTKRDRHDRQQPFNLKIGWSSTQTTGASGTIYNVSWVQFFQADLLRGYLLGGSNPAPGRRVVATPLHDTMAENVATPGAPTGALRLGDDGSFAAILPAGKAMTWHLLDNDAAKTSQVKERFWITFQPGEVRTCANCHGINTVDQAGSPKPTNSPQALATLLQFWKGNHPPGTMQHAAAAKGALKTAGTATLAVTRSGGSTGPVSVQYATANGTASAGVDYSATSGTLQWLDGDTTPKNIVVPLLNNPVIAASKTFTVTLSSPVNGSLGSQTVVTVTLNEKPFPTWQFQKFGANANTASIAGDTSDPDADGVVNLLEYAFGTNPKSAVSSALPVVGAQVINGVASIVLTYVRDVTHTDLVYQAQSTIDFVHWSNLSDTLVNVNGNVETRQASVPLSGNAQVFLRVQITRQ